MSINFMHVAGAFSLVGTALMVKNQLDDENYESAGYVLFEIAGVQIDLKIWLPLLVAIPLFLLGQVFATAKKTTEAAAPVPYEIEEIEEMEEIEEEIEVSSEDDDDEADLIARIEARTVSGRKAASASANKGLPQKSPVANNKASGKKSRAKTPVKKASVKKSAPKKSPAKKSSVKKSKSKSKSPARKASPVVISKSAKKALAAHASAKKKSAAKKAPKKSPAKKAVKKTRAKTPVRAVSQVRRSRRGKKTPTKYDPAVTNQTTFF